MEDIYDNVTRLRTFFDYCDDDKDGYIDVEHFMSLAKDHFGGGELDIKEITGIVQLLDPEGRGLVSFDDFCNGVWQIVDVQHQAQSKVKSSISEDTLLDGHDIPFDKTLTKDSQVDGELEDREPQPCSHHRPSGIISDLNHTAAQPSSLTVVESLSNSLINNSLTASHSYNSFLPPGSEDDVHSAISGHSLDLNENSRIEATDDDNFEYFRDAYSEEDRSDQGFVTIAQRIQVDKKSLLLKTQKRASDTNLQLSDSESNCTYHSPYSSDVIFSDIDGNFQDLNARLKFLEGRLTELTDNQEDTNIKQAKLKNENGSLVRKVTCLEEQLRDMEFRAELHLVDERRNNQDLLVRRDKDKAVEVDYLSIRLQEMEKEYMSMKEEVISLRHEAGTLRSEKLDLQEQLFEKQELYNVLYEDNERLKSENDRQSVLFQREKCSVGQLLNDLNNEVEELRTFKINSRSSDGTLVGACMVGEPVDQYQVLQFEIDKLKQDNMNLLSRSEDLSTKLVYHCVQEGRSLLLDESSKSLAEELDDLSKEELMKQLHQEQDYNFRLRQYIDRIILNILDLKPSLLEIKSKCH